MTAFEHLNLAATVENIELTNVQLGRHFIGRVMGIPIVLDIDKLEIATDPYDAQVGRTTFVGKNPSEQAQWINRVSVTLKGNYICLLNYLNDLPNPTGESTLAMLNKKIYSQELMLEIPIEFSIDDLLVYSMPSYNMALPYIKLIDTLYCQANSDFINDHWKGNGLALRMINNAREFVAYLGSYLYISDPANVITTHELRTTGISKIVQLTTDYTKANPKALGTKLITQLATAYIDGDSKYTELRDKAINKFCTIITSNVEDFYELSRD